MTWLWHFVSGRDNNQARLMEPGAAGGVQFTRFPSLAKEAS